MMANTPTDESTSTPGGEPASAPTIEDDKVHLAYDGRPVDR